MSDVVFFVCGVLAAVSVGGIASILFAIALGKIEV